MFTKINVLLVASLLVLSVAGCSGRSAGTEAQAETEAAAIQTENTVESGQEGAQAGAVGELPDLEIRFGYDGEPFILRLYNNDTAAEIARDVGEASWNLPIYHYDDFENHEVMQYYDIPGRYTIPSDPETITSERAGEVYYSEPNRMILFYHDAEVTGEYTKVGTIEGTGELSEAVENNPVLEGWSNKIVSIQWAQ